MNEDRSIRAADSDPARGGTNPESAEGEPRTKGPVMCGVQSWSAADPESSPVRGAGRGDGEDRVSPELMKMF